MLDLDRPPPGREVPPPFLELFGRDFEKADLVEEAQQPRLAVLEDVGLAIGVPHLDGAPEQLVTARAFHPVDAHIGAADPDDIGRGPGARGVVFGRNESMPRIDGCGDGGAQIDIAQSHHQVAGIEYDILHRIGIGQAVDPANEFDVVGTPGRIVAHRRHIFLDGRNGRGVAPAERQVDDPRGDGEILEIAELVLAFHQRCEGGALVELLAVEMELERADARGDVDHPVEPFRLEHGHQRMDADTQFEIEHDRPVFDQDIAIALLPVDGSRTMPLGGDFGEDRAVIGRCARLAVRRHPGRCPG